MGDPNCKHIVFWLASIGVGRKRLGEGKRFALDVSSPFNYVLAIMIFLAAVSSFHAGICGFIDAE
jgi:hypothetical protein